jgi:hypothetical protein
MQQQQELVACATENHLALCILPEVPHFIIVEFGFMEMELLMMLYLPPFICFKEYGLKLE